MVGIYKITNLVNGKIYIGQSINIDKRIKEHFWKASNEKDISYNSALHLAIRKYGKENFQWEILEECKVDNIDEREKFYIKEYNSLTPNGYNILSGGQAKRSEPNRCENCGCEIDRQSKRCIKCNHLLQYVCQHPSRTELKTMIRTIPFTKIAKQYGVSDKAVSKWCQSEGLPHRKKDIKQYSDEEWNLL